MSEFQARTTRSAVTNEEPPESSASLRMWQELGFGYQQKFGLDKDAEFERRINSVFRKEIATTYWKAFKDRLFSEGIQAKIAAKLKVDPGTVSRWKNDKTQPEFSDFALCAAAFDFDFAEDTNFPRGAHAAIIGYQAVIDDIAKTVDDMSACGIHDFEVLYMFSCCRDDDWFRALGNNDLRRLEEAARRIYRHVEDTLADAPLLRVPEIQMMQNKYKVPWSILEAVLPYEWIK